jgi:hypothetical protein
MRATESRKQLRMSFGTCAKLSLIGIRGLLTHCTHCTTHKYWSARLTVHVETINTEAKRRSYWCYSCAKEQDYGTADEGERHHMSQLDHNPANGDKLFRRFLANVHSLGLNLFRFLFDT